MLWIDCPWCGARPETEFRYGGEAHIARPEPGATDDAGWADYDEAAHGPAGEVHFAGVRMLQGGFVFVGADADDDFVVHDAA